MSDPREPARSYTAILAALAGRAESIREQEARITLGPTTTYSFGPYEGYRFPGPAPTPPCSHSALSPADTCLGCGRTHAQIEGAERAEERDYQVPVWAPRLTKGRMPRG